MKIVFLEEVRLVFALGRNFTTWRCRLDPNAGNFQCDLFKMICTFLIMLKQLANVDGTWYLILKLENWVPESKSMLFMNDLFIYIFCV